MFVKRNGDAYSMKACTRLVVVEEMPGTTAIGRSRKTWQNTQSADMCLLNVDLRYIHKRKKWRAIGWR